MDMSIARVVLCRADAVSLSKLVAKHLVLDASRLDAAEWSYRREADVAPSFRHVVAVVAEQSSRHAVVVAPSFRLVEPASALLFSLGAELSHVAELSDATTVATTTTVEPRGAPQHAAAAVLFCA